LTRYALHALIADPGSWPAGRAFAWLSNWTWVIPITMHAFLLLLFPTGYVRSRRWRPAAWFVGVVSALSAVLLLIAATRLWTDPFISSSRVHGLNAVLYTMTTFLVSAALLVSVTALVVRFAAHPTGP
jgi:hypothetical protein